MAEEATTQSPAPAQPQTQSTEQASPLDKVFNEYKIEDTAATFQPAPQVQAPQHQAQTIAPPKTPDPFDPGFPVWQQSVTGQVAQINQAVAQTATQLTQMQRELQARKVEADIKQAVGVIAEKAGIDPDLAEVHLEVTARKDPRFKAVWENREKNPRAYQAAIQAAAEIAKDKYTVRQDPQLAENQRAMKVSQQQMATAARQKSEQDSWAEMSPADRAREWNKLLRAGGR